MGGRSTFDFFANLFHLSVSLHPGHGQLHSLEGDLSLRIVKEIGQEPRDPRRPAYPLIAYIDIAILVSHSHFALTGDIAAAVGKSEQKCESPVPIYDFPLPPCASRVAH